MCTTPHQTTSTGIIEHHLGATMRMLRAAALAIAGLALTRVLGGWAVALLSRGPARVDDVVALGAVTLGATLAAWYCLTAVALLLAELAHLSRHSWPLAAGLRAGVARLGAPVLRRAALVGVGAGLALGATPAGAGPQAAMGALAPTGPPVSLATPADEHDAVPHDLRPGLSPVDEELPEPPAGDTRRADGQASTGGDGVAGEHNEATGPAGGGRADAPSGAPAGGTGTGAPVDERTGPAADPAQTDSPRDGAGPGARVGSPSVAADPRGDAPAPADVREPATGPADVETVRSYTVQRGDSLWSIATAHLHPRATSAEIAAEWPRWYRTNRAVIGADPDLIHPGQQLAAPEPEDTP